MPFRMLTWILLISGLALVAVAGYGFFGQAAEYGLMARDTDIEVAECAGGQDTEVKIHLHNNSGRPIRLLGGAAC